MDGQPEKGGQGNGAFRANAEQKLLSPKNLQLGVEIIRTPQWLILLTALAVVGVSLIVSFFLPVPIKVDAKGILITTEGVKDIESTTSGLVKDIIISPGDYVRRGQPFAWLEQPDIEYKLTSAQEELLQVRKKYDKVERFHERTKTNFAAHNEIKRTNLLNLIKAGKEQIAWLNKSLDAYEKLSEKGFVTRKNLFELQVRLNETQEKIIKYENELDQLQFDNRARIIEQERELLDLQTQIEQARQKVASFREQKTRKTYISSPYDGIIIEQKINVGELVEIGTPILSVMPGFQATNKDNISQIIPLVATLYLPASEGKKVQEGMRVQLVPSSVKKEEYGFIYGEITDVSAVPVTPEGMLRTLKNQKLVENLSKEGAPLRVNASLEMDPNTFSGFKWSSSSGPEQTISAGTLCDAEVVIKEQKLVHLFLPALRRLVGGVTK